MKKIITITTLAILALTATTPVLAAKKRVWSKTAVASGVSGPGVGAKLTKWKQYVNLSFYGLSKVNRVEYELTYNGNGTEQGIFGDIAVDKSSVGREMFLGTCSHGACVAHKNVSSLKLTITYKMKDGTQIVKRYRLKY